MRSVVRHSAPEMSLEPDLFKRAFRNHAAGVAVITADPGGAPVALTATSVFSVSAEPPLLVFSISSSSSSAPAILASETLVVHLLGSDQLGLAQLCSTPGADRFAPETGWQRLETGEPYYPGAPTHIRGTVVTRVAAGSSTVVVVHALDAEIDEDGSAPLVYHNRTWHSVGDHSSLAG